jgi:enoyl-CoA hydratase/carnithine racemase
MGLVRYELHEHLVTVTLDRPEKLNAMNEAMLADLRDAWVRYQNDDDAWIALLTGSGRAFSAGADLELIRSWAADGRFFPMHYLSTIARDPYFAGEIDKPTVAVVNGYALGGGFDLVLRSDLRLAAESAVFGVPEVDLGGVLLFWDNLPYAITAEILVGGKISAQRAYEVGIVNKVVPDNLLMDAATELARELLRKPQPALRAALRAMREMKAASSPFSRRMELQYAGLLGLGLSRSGEEAGGKP